ncbi:hypothetical protein PFICI_12549 [Pestalotiopsis fici W106-1]|uniref:Uncharacterized protein n=1 Tax=Pestalotiopsis fici (strain W106-1 / CGMCC3.15140) TaxID=1229662 RepID=W3WNW4_PESFW|nr:uncharacterized protein PFICI_12549 [Pestalotiopsis fici W106-1]ETS75605.1 hypothetical protein PFICI_12549 [Pestalotiopsis fici W106-1]
MAPSVSMLIQAPDGTETFGKRSPIAICGMALRLPGGIATPAQFWEFIMQKKDAVGPIPESRFNAESYVSNSGKPGYIRSAKGYFLDGDIGALDTTFFSMAKAEVEKADPQQRILLELARECLDSAGEVNYRGKDIGTYVGSFGEDWPDHFARDSQSVGLYQVTGKGDFVLSNRISYEYDLRGPSMTIRTACSSSLLALHEACLSLWTGGCSSALVGGCNIMMSPDMALQMTEQGVLSPDASCKTFDEKANGYARAEAVNLIYIKPLQDALRDGNPVRAVIKGAWTNADGKTTGLSVPSISSHETMIRRAYASAGISDLSQTAFVECHGTGTAIGDPIETKAIQSVFTSGVFIGSVKPNVGHSEGASGISSIIKCVLALENQTIPPNIKFSQPSTRIDWKNLYVPTEPMLWPVDCQERVSVNSFGIGGANAHFILESCRAVGAADIEGIRDLPSPTNSLILLSANTSDSAKRQVSNHEEYLQKHPSRLDDAAYTLGVRRQHMPYRSFGVAGDYTNNNNQRMALDTSVPTKIPTGHQKIAMVFTGQGAQWARMGVELLHANSTFAASIQFMDQVLSELPDGPSWSIQDELEKTAAESSLHMAVLSQPLCTAIQVALVDALADLSLRPEAVVGHSSGEIAAAYASGRITAREAIIVAYYRGMASTSVSRKGAMGAIGMSRKEIEPLLRPGVVVACENSPMNVTISGDKEKVEEVLQDVRSAKGEMVPIKLLKVDKAYHSHHMKAVGDTYTSMISKYLSDQKRRGQTSAVMYSSVTGAPLDVSRHLDAQYWQDNLESPVLFRSAVESLLKEQEKPGNTLIFVEVGPHSALSGPLRQILAQESSKSSYTSCLIRSQDAHATFLRAVGCIWQQGISFDYDRLLNPHGYAKVVHDLPSYPWHHEHSYIFGSRVSNHTRVHRYRRHELLGTRSAESSDDEPQFRNMLVPDRVAWLKDHCIDGDVVFPCAAYLAMVGEAMRQLHNGEYSGYSVKKVAIGTAMVISNGQKPVEIITSLRKVRLTDTLDGSWWDFTISTNSGSSWMRHCAGQVRADNQDMSHSEISKSHEFTRVVNTKNWYSAYRSVGADYGPTFQVLRDIAASTTTQVCKGTVLDVVKENEEDYAIHPTTIDGFLQLFGIAAHKGGAHKLSRMNVPTFIESMTVAACKSGVTTVVEASISPRGTLNGRGQGFDDNDSLVFNAKGVRLSPLSTGAASSTDVDLHAAARTVWNSHVEFLDLSSLANKTENHARQIDICRDLCLQCIQESLLCLQEAGISHGVPSHFDRFLSWMRKQPAPSSGQKAQILREKLINTPYDAFGEGSLKVLNNIVPLFKGEVQLLELLLRDGTLTDIYNGSVFANTEPLFRALGHTCPNMRILEIGAGTGGTTSRLLNCLVSDNENARLYLDYTYTDVSPGFFAAAKERFQEYPNLHFKALDISKDPLEQGFALESFDLVLASNVIHATNSLHQSLSNIRKLLRPTGRLYLEEMCSDFKGINYIMGLFQGWWLGDEDGRSEEPYVSTDRWDKELRRAGFGGLVSATLDAPRPYQMCALMLAKPDNSQTMQKTVAILHDSYSRGLALSLQERFSAEQNVVLHDIEKPALPEVANVISVIDLERPFLHDITEQRFLVFQGLMEELAKTQKGCLWLTRSSQLGCTDPRWSQVIGAARTIRRDLGLDLATCEIDHLDSQTWQAAMDVFHTFQAEKASSSQRIEYEYAIVNGVVQISRIFPFALKDELSAADVPNTNNDCFLDIGEYGRLQSLRWTSVPQVEALRHDEIVIDVKCVGLNFKDLLVAMGVIEFSASAHGAPSKLGIEGVGVVRSVGPGVRGVKVGQRVFTMMSHGCFATRVTVSEKYCAPIPDSLSDEGAATMPCVFATAVYGLVDVGQLRAHQTVLIHSACGGVGLAAIQVAQMIGAEIYCTVSTEEKIHFLETNFGIRRDHIFNSRDDSFLAGVRAATNGRGVDLVLNSLSGELLHASWRCVAEFGKLIEIGKRDLVGNGSLDMRPFLENRSYHGVDLNQFFDAKPEECHRLLEEILRLYAEGYIRPLHPVKAFTEQDVEACFRYMQKGQHIGKIVMTVAPSQLKGIRPVTRQMVMDCESSFVLIGGLGGLGRVVASYMVERGARHLIFLSRTAGSSKHDQAFAEELSSQGCSITFVQGDVTVLSDVQHAVAKAPTTIKGVINMSMVLRDSRFESMTYEEWTAATGPKVQGTWNLHHACLERELELDFFILFSSISGIIGQPGQANYASGNAFLDAFVQYRQSKGLKASVIDVGVMLDHGYLAENEAMQQQMVSHGHFGIRTPQLLDALTVAMLSQATPARQQPDGWSNTSQLVIGMASSKTLDDPTNWVVWKNDCRLAVFANRVSSEGAAQGSDEDALSKFIGSVASDPSILARPDTAVFVAKQIALQLRALLLKPVDNEDDIDIQTPLQNVGLDSLVAIELRTWWRGAFGSDITVLEMLSAESLSDLGFRAVAGLREKYAEQSLDRAEGSSDTLVVDHMDILPTKMP